MSDLRPLLEVGSERERALLRAGASEAPSVESVRNAARVLGLVPRAALVAWLLGSVARLAGRSAKALRSSAVLYGLAPALVLTGAVVAWRSVDVRPPAGPVGKSGALVNPAPAPVSIPAETTSAAPMAAATGEVWQTARGRSTEDSALARAPATPVRKASHDVSDSMREQLALIDRARARMGSGDPAGALRELDRYDREFPGGMLSEEALLLRVEAFAAQGDRASTAALARRFLSAYPRSVHASRVRGVLARISE
jgi:hypothetical protein